MYKVLKFVFLLLLPWAFFTYNRHQLLPLPGAPVALVLGAGLFGGIPSPVLSSRLDQAVNLYNSQKIKRIIVSGDNRETNYNEPEAMKNYLIKRGIPDNIIIQDFGGRRTIDSCWRAKNVFKANIVYIVTQEFHLPRSIFLCQSMSLEVVPYPSADSLTLSKFIYQTVREIFASWRAIFEFVHYEPTIKSNGSEPDLSVF